MSTMSEYLESLRGKSVAVIGMGVSLSLIHISEPTRPY